MLAAALIINLAGVVWLALAMEAHWRQVRGPQTLTRRAALVLRTLGTASLSVSLGLCFTADHATMAPLVWIMALAAAALIVALALAWRPRALGPLIAWLRRA